MSVLETFIDRLAAPERDAYEETCHAIIKLEASLKKNVEDLSLIEAQKRLIGPHVEFLKKRLQGLYDQRASLELRALRDKQGNSDNQNFNSPQAGQAPGRSTASAG